MPSHFQLEIYLSAELTRRVPVGPQGLTIGRSSTNQVVLASREISKQHAQLMVRGTSVLLTDLGSTSGTFIRGQRVSVTALEVGEEFAIGPYRLRLAKGDDGAQEPPAGGADGVVKSTTAAQVSGEKGLAELSALVGVTDQQAVLETLLGRMIGLSGATSGFVVLVHGGQLSPVLARAGPAFSADDRISQTICRRAIAERAPICLTGASAGNVLREIESLAVRLPEMILALPLSDENEVLGVMYLEGHLPLPGAGESLATMLEQVSVLGGRALAGALKCRQIIQDRDRWQWLAAILSDQPDIFRSCRSQAMKGVLEIVRRTAMENVTALIRGESGTGKEITALTIHRLSARANGPFTAINCGALPRDLVEAELFGYERGAFTGATAAKPGRLELAQDGTLLLDEVGELAKDLQVKLLRTLETRTVERVGGRETIPWNARVLAATNCDLEAAIAKGEFREDLYYRLNVVAIDLPPLRQRTEDIESLTNEILLVTNRRFTKKLCGVTPEAIQLLQSYRWPGNIRELRNVVERAFILEATEWVTPKSLPFAGGERPASPAAPPVGPALTEDQILPLAEWVTQSERAYIQQVLDRVEGNVTQAARLLGLARGSLQRKLKQLGIKSHEFRQDGE